jgi:hypothetical protein
VRVRVVWWDLDGSATVDGLRLKLWIADEERNRWGAVYLWESEEASGQPLPSRARQIIGKDPDFEEWFDLEASVEGAFARPELARRGAAFAPA